MTDTQSTHLQHLLTLHLHCEQLRKNHLTPSVRLMIELQGNAREDLPQQAKDALDLLKSTLGFHPTGQEFHQGEWDNFSALVRPLAIRHPFAAGLVSRAYHLVELKGYQTVTEEIHRWFHDVAAELKGCTREMEDLYHHVRQYPTHEWLPASLLVDGGRQEVFYYHESREIDQNRWLLDPHLRVLDAADFREALQMVYSGNIQDLYREAREQFNLVADRYLVVGGALLKPDLSGNFTLRSIYPETFAL